MIESFLMSAPMIWLGEHIAYGIGILILIAWCWGALTGSIGADSSDADQRRQEEEWWFQQQLLQQQARERHEREDHCHHHRW